MFTAAWPEGRSLSSGRPLCLLLLYTIIVQNCLAADCAKVLYSIWIPVIRGLLDKRIHFDVRP